MEKFYSSTLRCTVKQINKTSARKRFENGETIYFHPSKMRFDNPWQNPVDVQKNGRWFKDYSFDTICNYFENYNCDSERGKYIHFFVKC